MLTRTLLYIYAQYAYYCKDFALKTLVLKIGGRALQGEIATLGALPRLRSEGWDVVIVHGGGLQIDRNLAGAAPARRVRGLRITDGAALEAAEAALCGTVNKALVRACVRAGVLAVGLSGQDGAMLRAMRSPPLDGVDLGYVGLVTEVNVEALRALLGAGFAPVVAPMAIAADAAHALNVNADTAAAAIAAGLQADVLAMITDVAGVLRDPARADSLVAAMDLRAAEAFLSSDACGSGMQPKLEAVVDALRAGVREAVICGADANALADAMAHRGGTAISPNG